MHNNNHLQLDCNLKLLPIYKNNIQSKQMRLHQFDFLRAVTIICIVAGHAQYGIISDNNFFGKLLVNLFSGGTSIFVFISGFFFHFLYFKNFNYIKFMVNKIKNIYSPYFLLSTLAFIVYLFMGKQFHNTQSIEIIDASSWFETFKIYISYLEFGKASQSYWYIPFIMIIFLLSPIFLLFIRFSLRYRVALNLLLLFVSIKVQRPITNYNLYQDILYFIPMYLLGINYSMSKDKVTHFIKDKFLIIFTLTIFFATLQILYFDKNCCFDGNALFASYNQILITSHNIFLIFSLLFVMQFFETKEYIGIKLISSFSFAIYFLHLFVNQILIKFKIVSILCIYLPEILCWILVSNLVILLTIFLAFLIKLLFKMKSRYIIGC